MATGTAQGPLLEMRSVCKGFPGVQALHDINLRVQPASVLALVGENGAGKSTLIKILSGALRPDSGEVFIDGTAAQLRSPADAASHGVSTVYQEFSLFPSLTVAENLFFNEISRLKKPLRWGKIRAEAAASLERLDAPFGADRIVSQLSIAEQQLLEIAKALHRRSKIVVLDEPTAVLGGRDVDQLLSAIRSLRQHDVGVLFISHRLEEVFDVADDFLVLKDGRSVATGRVRETTKEQLLAHMAGPRPAAGVAAMPSRASSVTARPALVVEHLTRAGAFHDVSFDVKAGEIVGIAGLRGSGRTEVLRAIFGADPADSGTVLVHGNATHFRNPRQAVAAGLGLVPEDRKTQGLLLHMSVTHNTSLVDVCSGGRRFLRGRAERSCARRYVDDLKIRVSGLGQAVVGLSGGNQQKIVLAKWMHANTTVLLMDEPTRGIDVNAKAEMYRLMRQMCQQGMAVVLVSSELPELLLMSDRVLVMQQGRITAHMDRADASEAGVLECMVSEAAA